MALCRFPLIGPTARHETNKRNVKHKKLRQIKSLAGNIRKIHRKILQSARVFCLFQIFSKKMSNCMQRGVRGGAVKLRLSLFALDPPLLCNEYHTIPCQHNCLDPLPHLLLPRLQWIQHCYASHYSITAKVSLISVLLTQISL